MLILRKTLRFKLNYSNSFISKKYYHQTVQESAAGPL